MKKYESVSRKETKSMNTEEIRNNFLVNGIFKENKISYNYSYYDRVIIGGAMPMNDILSFDLSKELGVEYFLERREIGLINIGGPGNVVVDDKKYELLNKDGIYIGVGNKKIEISSTDSKNPMKLFFMSTTGLKEYPNKVIKISNAEPLKLGEQKLLNKRTIYQYFHPKTCQTNQLLMGMTVLEEGNVWNTMPPHTHERRMEAYFYFDMDDDQRVFHMHGEPQETRHIIVKNEESILSPSWSIHGGVGTSKYTFIWAMAGENQTFSDMEKIEIKELK